MALTFKIRGGGTGGKGFLGQEELSAASSRTPMPIILSCDCGRQALKGTPSAMPSTRCSPPATIKDLPMRRI